MRTRRRAAGWPVELSAAVDGGLLSLRPCALRDEHRFLALRLANEDWLAPWDATVPEVQRARMTPTAFRTMVRGLTREARAGAQLPWFLWFADASGVPSLIGQLTVGPIIGGSARSAGLGYWIDRDHAGRGLMTAAVAAAVDHLILERRLHRIEIAVRPENAASLRVVEKLGLREEGLRERYLHIDGAWVDHRCFALTAEELGPGLLPRVPGAGPLRTRYPRPSLLTAAGA